MGKRGYGSLEIIRTVAHRAERRRSRDLGDAPQEVWDAVVERVHIGGGDYFRAFFRRPVNRIDIAGEVADFFPSTSFGADGRIFGKYLVSTRRLTGRRQNSRM